MYMDKIIDVDGFQIEQSRIDNIVKDIIGVLAKENITHAIAYMILEETKLKLDNTLVRIDA